MDSRYAYLSYHLYSPVYSLSKDASELIRSLWHLDLHLAAEVLVSSNIYPVTLASLISGRRLPQLSQRFVLPDSFRQGKIIWWMC